MTRSPLALALLALLAALACPAQEPASRPAQAMKLWRAIPLPPEAHGTFPSAGDLDGDGRVDFLLHRQGPLSTPGFLTAVNLEGRRLWARGDAGLSGHTPDGQWREPALRGIALVWDLDGDGKAEALAELWEDGRPLLVALDGATGSILASRPSPFDLAVRGGKRSRAHLVGLIFYPDGPDAAPALALKYGASNMVPTLACAVDGRLRELWRLPAGPKAMGHVPTVADVDGDGREEVLLGSLLAGPDGAPRWEHPTERHADCTAAADLHPEPGLELLVAICGTGPLFCLSAAGKVLWAKTKQDVPHGQGVWAGEFLPEEPGPEVVVLKSGHVGDFLTLRGRDGAELAAFKHEGVYKGYPDFPAPVAWAGDGSLALYIPVDRILVDGRGRPLARLGPESEAWVRELLRYGTTKKDVAVQALALDLCGDGREEVVLYQPYSGRALLVFTQPDGDGREKPWRPTRAAANVRSYF